MARPEHVQAPLLERAALHVAGVPGRAAPDALGERAAVGAERRLVAAEDRLPGADLPGLRLPWQVDRLGGQGHVDREAGGRGEHGGPEAALVPEAAPRSRVPLAGVGGVGGAQAGTGVGRHEAAAASGAAPAGGGAGGDRRRGGRRGDHRRDRRDDRRDGRGREGDAAR